LGASFLGVSNALYGQLARILCGGALRCAYRRCCNLFRRRDVLPRLTAMLEQALANVARIVLRAVVVPMEQRPTHRIGDQPTARLLLVQLAATADHLGTVRAGLRRRAHQVLDCL
jgi:hypothetical protein